MPTDKPITTIAREVLDLAGRADRVLAEYNGVPAICVPAEARDIATAWNDYVCRTKHGPGEIARLAEALVRIDEHTRRMLLDSEEGDQWDEGYDDATREVRASLGLPTLDTPPVDAQESKS